MPPLLKVVWRPLLAAALFGCAAPGASPTSGDMPRVNRSSIAAPVMEKFRPEVGDYLAEIQRDNDYANWKVPPSTAFNQ